MHRQLHKFTGLFAAILLSILAISGTILSVYPALERSAAVFVPEGQVSVGDLAGRIEKIYPGVDQIKRTTEGTIIVYHVENDRPAEIIVNPVNGEYLGDYTRSKFERWMKSFHRSFFLGDGGRLVAGLGALSMLLLTITGLQVTARRLGGWNQLASRVRGTKAQRLHVETGRVAVAGLFLSGVTALYMSAATFDLIPAKDSQTFTPLIETGGGTHLDVGQITALQYYDLSQLRELTFPYDGDPDSSYELQTTSGEGAVNPVTGELASWQDYPQSQMIYTFIRMLHTGQGLWWLGLFLGITALSVPFFGVTGVIIWLAGCRSRPRMTDNSAARTADTIILVGSEGGSSWGFAATLHKALVEAGHKVHTGPMNSIAQTYPAAQRMFIFAATYGNGEAPANARLFVKKVKEIKTPFAFPVAILGFGDRQFPEYCRFSSDLEVLFVRKGWTMLMPADTINRQSTQEFARWGKALSKAMHETIELQHALVLPSTHALTLVSRRDYGVEVEAPTVILRFALPKHQPFGFLTGRGWPRFMAGDLVGIIPRGSEVLRYYSLASSTRDGFLEICVRKHFNGECSGLLHGLQPGECVDGFIKPNPGFRPLSGKAPVILIGAGTGIGPLAGTIRDNANKRPMHLYFGVRDPASDFLYQTEIESWLGDGRLTSLNMAFSRAEDHDYVQDRVRADADRIAAMVAGGAQIMVCGGRNMAAGVSEAVADILTSKNINLATLKVQGRYIEDVY